MNPHNSPKPSLVVFYNKRSERVGKVFRGDEYHKARSFYLLKVRTGKQPAVRKFDERDQIK